MVWTVFPGLKETQETLGNLDHQERQENRDHLDLLDEGATWENLGRKERQA